jgi:hypothetical protein
VTEAVIEVFLGRGLLLGVWERREGRAGTVMVVVEGGGFRGGLVAFFIWSLRSGEPKMSGEGKLIEIVERL